MKVGMTLPITEPGWSRDILLQWVSKIEAGPFSSLALGERIAFVNPELMTTLGACAVLTERVRLVATVVILPMHDPVLTAKQLATVDLFSQGRLTVGVGVGGREEDYQSIGADLRKRRLATLEECVAMMRRVWAGEKVRPEMRRPVEPFPVQKGGPTILAGCIGPKAIAHAAGWADGITGFSFSAAGAEAAATFQRFEDAWRERKRAGQPIRGTSFWFALGDKPEEQKKTHLRRYFNWLPPEIVEQMIPQTGFAGTALQLRERLDQMEAAGADEVLLIPTTIDPAEVDRVAKVL